MIIVFICVCLLLIAMASDAHAESGSGFDIGPFSLPNCEPGEVRFEEPRDIQRIVVTFKGAAPKNAGLSYMHKIWPSKRVERDYKGVDNAMGMGWYSIEDWFNCTWQKASVNVKRKGESALEITFKGLTSEYPDHQDYDVTYRRTQGFRIEADSPGDIKKVEAFTTSTPVKTTIRVHLNAGVKSGFDHISVTGYNATISKVKALSGVTVSKSGVTVGKDKNPEFEVQATHMTPAHRFSGDAGCITFSYGSDAFTISLAEKGPIWFTDKGVYITLADDKTTFQDYQAQNAGKKTISQQVAAMREQSLGGAMNGQPNPHADSFIVGCKNARQRFRIEPNGDIEFAKMVMDWVKLSDSARYSANGSIRFFFGMEKMRIAARYPDPAPLIAYNMHVQSDDIAIEQKTFATPLLKSVSDRQLVADDTIIAIVRFTLKNTTDHETVARLPIGFSTESGQTYDRLSAGSQHDTTMSGNRVPLSKRDKLTFETSEMEPSLKILTSVWNDQKTVRCAVDTAMEASENGDEILLQKTLQPGESCEVTLKIPAISLTEKVEFKRLASISPDKAYSESSQYWRELGKLGAQIHTPEPRLNALYQSHFAYISVADFAMPDDPYLINTSVGSSIYPNYTNESCMILDELDGRGLHEEVRRRLAVWLKYQGTVGLRGNFSDHEGVLFGAGGFECGDTYDQHHGWALWYLAKHFFMTGDEEWMKSAADSVVKGADWIFRQRKQTIEALPHSRGWEKGFLPAGSLEDVSDYFYWLSTNAVTWRGAEYAARALEAIGHPEAARVRTEADAYKKDLIAGYEHSRQMSPLIKLQDGRWIPHYPSRLYLRGRDTGWIREILEGSVYLLISELYDSNSKQGQWILDDFQDTRYMNPDFGYPIYDPDRLWFDVGGFSCQPNLLAGLMPYLATDEPEVYIWMFFNAWASCYREDVNAMVEHPQPILGHSNAAIVKTSDEANAMAWLTYMLVYAHADTLYLGRAIPREWFADGQSVSAEKLSTHFGDISLAYHSQAAKGTITLDVDLTLRNQPAQIQARFRHPDKLLIKSVQVNGTEYSKFDPEKGDVDITGLNGKVQIEAAY